MSAVADLVGPGGQYEIVVEDVLGADLQVYKNRFASMRDVIAIGDARADVDWLVQGDRRLTFGEHNALTRKVAVALTDLGVERGDRVAILTANTIEWVVMFWACAGMGVAAVPLNAWWKAEELEFALRDSGAKVLFCDPKRWAIVHDIVETIPTLEHVYVMDLDEPDGKAQPGVDLLAPEDPGALLDVTVEEDDILAILYTSGTTGKPKGATITHRQALANLMNLALGSQANAAMGKGEQRTEHQAAALLIVPLFHVTGTCSTMIVAYAGGSKLVLMPPGRFDADHAMATIEREKVSSIGGVPTVMWRIVEADNFADYDLSSVTRIGYGGAPAAPELVERIKASFPHVRSSLSTAYGLTESASVATAISGDEYFARPDSVGRPVPTVEAMVIDDEGTPQPANTTGELALRGPTIMMRGYWNRADATDAVFLPGGWFRTGDIARIDDDGFVYLVDRAKDMIIRAGENVYCVEVEHILHDHPDVLDAALVGVPHRTLGEEVKAVVQLRKGSTATVEDIRSHCAQHLAGFKVPEYVEFREEPLPRNPAGKILKQLLRGDAAASAFSEAAADDAVL
ncbi:MAG: acyl--CoA ligase [Acidimicrobiia bacterium]|nr:acyl--CoA ligase [Acidimicrobiia bacterium]